MPFFCRDFKVDFLEGLMLNTETRLKTVTLKQKCIYIKYISGSHGRMEYGNAITHP